MPTTFLHGTEPAGKVAKRQERRAAERRGGRRVPGSGNQPMARGDVRTKDWLMEEKFTAARSFSVRLDVLHKIVCEALAIDKLPALEIEFKTDGLMREGERWMMIPSDVFDEIVKCR